MKNKGFTLVELLAVIAIMAVIIIIAIPNVLSSLNEARRENFANEVKNLTSTAKTQFNLDKGKGTIKYKIEEGYRYAYYCLNNDAEECADALTLPINDESIIYMFKLDSEGILMKAEVSNGRFTYYCGSSDDCKTFNEEFIYDSTEEKPDEEEVQEP